MKKIKYLLLAAALLVSYSAFADNIDKEDDEWLSRGRNGEIDDMYYGDTDPIGPFILCGLQDIPGARGKDGGVGKND